MLWTRVEATLPTGRYTLCKAPAGGEEREMVGMAVDIIPKPTFATGQVTIGKAQEATLVRLAGGAAGDFVVMTTSGCETANETTTTGRSLGKTTLGTGFAFGEGGGFYTSPSMGEEARLNLCYATKESGGLLGTDFVPIGVFEQ